MASFFLMGGHDFDLKRNDIASYLLKLVKPNPLILLFPTAHLDKEKAVKNFKREFSGLTYRLETINLEERIDHETILARAIEADILYFTGGNTASCLSFLKESGYDKLLFKLASLDVVIAGVSAGAMLFCHYGLADANAYKDNNKYYNYSLIECLNIIDISLAPHFNEDDRILYFKDFLTTEKAYALDNNTAIYIKNNRVVTFYAIDGYRVFSFDKGNNYRMVPLKKEKIVTLGPKGTFSDLATKTYIGQENTFYAITYENSMQKVAMQLDDNNYAILPIENSIDGYVTEVIDIMHEYNLKIKSVIKLPVNFTFITKACKIENVKKVYVQFKAKGQCLNFINQYGFEVIETESNILSLEKLNESISEYGAIVPSHINTASFNIKVLNVSDFPNNYTRFVVLKKNLEFELKNEFRCAILIEPSTDHPGLLMDALLKFKEEDINIEVIMSRPVKKRLGTYYFYIEFATKKDNYFRLIGKFKQMSNFKIYELGIF